MDMRNAERKWLAIVILLAAAMHAFSAVAQISLASQRPEIPLVLDLYLPVPGKQKDQGAFKTPTLRNISQTAPYMHDGSLATLEEVIEFYDRGWNSNPYLDPELRPLHLTVEKKEALLAFLKALSGTIHESKLR